MNDGPVLFFIAHRHARALGNEFNDISTPTLEHFWRGMNTDIGRKTGRRFNRSPESYYHPRPLIYDPTKARFTFLEKRKQMLELLAPDPELQHLFEHEPEPQTDLQRIVLYRRYVDALNATFHP